jgi:hypothetical protein
MALKGRRGPFPLRLFGVDPDPQADLRSLCSKKGPKALQEGEGVEDKVVGILHEFQGLGLVKGRSKRMHFPTHGFPAQSGLVGRAGAGSLEVILQEVKALEEAIALEGQEDLGSRSLLDFLEDLTVGL